MQKAIWKEEEEKEKKTKTENKVILFAFKGNENVSFVLTYVEEVTAQLKLNANAMYPLPLGGKCKRLASNATLPHAVICSQSGNETLGFCSRCWAIYIFLI